MTEEQLNIFLYNCKKIALSLHFIDSRVMERLISSYMVDNDNSYESVIARHTNIVKELHAGVCFTMSCYTKNLLDEMGIESYLMTSFNSVWPNTVVIYKYQDEYLVCDLAEQVRRYEEIKKDIGSIIISPSSIFTNDDINSLFEIGQNVNCLIKPLPEYFKKYPEITCEVIMHKDNENIDFDELPKIPIKEFLKQKLDHNKKV